MRQVEKIEINASQVIAVVKAFAAFPMLSKHLGTKFGFLLELSPNGEPQVDTSKRYPLSAMLSLLNDTERLLPGHGLRKVGSAVIRSALSTPGLKSVRETLELLDVACHMNHFKDGRCMYDESSGKKMDGLGSHDCVPVGGGAENRVRMVMGGPYPCEYDYGILHGITQFFEVSEGSVTHEEGACRKRGDSSCTYLVTWKEAA